MAVEADIVPLTLEAQARTGRRLYQEFLGVAESRGKARGWAFHLFLAKTGSKPPWSWRNLDPIEPSIEAAGFAKHRMIKFAKGREKARANA